MRTCTSFWAVSQRVLEIFQKLDPQTASTVALHCNAANAKVEARRPRALVVVKVGVVNGESKPKTIWFLTHYFRLTIQFCTF